MNAIDVQGISKIYRQYRAPSDSLKELIFRKKYHNVFWALKNINFTLPIGGQLGIIGDNGAGKSTLLKILAGTITQSDGELVIKGSTSAILELGSGFHPEFSGLDNARLGCSLRGLDNKQIAELLPEIIEFSELGEAIHRPVKTYSSGMYVRLAFSVATAIDPDNLIIDEALSVGDQHFQKKSLDRITGFRDSGKTIIFCSHNLYQVKSLCHTVLWLDRGEVKLLGDADDVIDQYQDYTRAENIQARAEEKDATLPAKESLASITNVTLHGKKSNQTEFVTGEDLKISVELESYKLRVKDLSVAIVLMRNDDIHVYGTSTEIESIELAAKGENRFIKTLVFDKLQLLSGSYRIYVYLLDENGIHIYDMREAVLPFSVRHSSKEMGVARIDHHWTDESASDQ